MSELKEVVLMDIAHIQTGPFGSQLKNEQYITGGTPVVTVEHIKDFRIIDFSYPSVTEEDRQRLSKYLLEEGDIIFTRVGSVDLSAYVKAHQSGWMFSSRMLRVRPNGKVCGRYLSYYFQQKRFKEHILSIAVGATMPSINTKILEDLPINLLPLPEQKAIAGVLSSLDDKIDLLHRQNKTLEAMAETMFRQWFIEEAEDDWEEITLKDFVKCITGYSYKSINLQPSHETALVNLKNFSRDGSFNLAGLKEYTGPYKESQLVSKGDLIVAHTDITQNADIIGQPALMIDTGKYKNLVISTDLVKVVPTTDLLDTYFLYYLFKSPDFKGYALGISNGTTVIHLSKKAIPDYSFSIPNFNIVRDFSEKVRANLIMINDNNSQISKLRIIRDLLLPKLMSGEVRVEL